MLELIVFETIPEKVKLLMEAGYSSFIVDLEVIGKDLRQLGYDTEINRNTTSDVSRLASCGVERIWTRINRFGDHTRNEIELALQGGSSYIILPMVGSVTEVDLTLRYVGGRAEVCVMIERPEGMEIANLLAQTSISAAYFGLNDYSISTRNRNIFAPLVDGAVMRVREQFRTKRFGVAGLTYPYSGSPIPSLRILQELERIDCSFTFMRRSFRRDISLFGAKEILESITFEWCRSSMRTTEERIADYRELVEQISAVNRSGLI